MESEFDIQIKRSNGNLHIKPSGDFDGNSAWKLINLLHDEYEGSGRVYIDTHDLRVRPFGCTIFKAHLNPKQLPSDKLHFKGKNGLPLAPDGSRVFYSTRRHICSCNGRCKSCKCKPKGPDIEQA